MLDEILLRDVALIREASMMPSAGLSVLTGESGSGKTAFLSGLKLLVGERGSAEMVRDGAPLLEVQGRFVPMHGDDPDVQTIASRTIAADGRSRVRLNGSMASVGDLAATVGATVDLCGQHEHQRLLKPANQGLMLDEWIGDDLEAPLQAYRAAWTEAAAARKRYDELLGAGREDAERLEQARFVLRRIGEVDPQPGEYEDLLSEARRMENIEDLVRNVGGAHAALSGEGGALDGLNLAVEMLSVAASLDGRLANAAKAAQDACYIVEDTAREVDALMPDAESFDAARLEELQDRLAAFQGLMRSYGPTIDEVLKRRDDAQRLLADYEDLDATLAASQRELQRAENELARAAQALSAVRSGKAPEFSRQVNAVLARLEMPGCALACNVERMERARWSARGADAVSFSFKPAPDAEPRPLARIASGGELSRVTLAVKAVMGAADAAETLVFDEVDAGVGGKAALAVGEVLAELARKRQVIVVTHLAQIAVLADAHFVVERAGRANAETRLRQVAGEERVAEVARMLSGAADPASIAHAREMLRGR